MYGYDNYFQVEFCKKSKELFVNLLSEEKIHDMIKNK